MKYIFSILIALSACKIPISKTADAAEAPHKKLQAASVEVLLNGRLVGSGCVASPSGQVLTANHVAVNDKDKLEILSLTLGRHPVTVLARDRGHDLLLLALPKRDAPYPHLTVAAAAPRVGEQVWLYGAPVFRHRVTLPGTIARAGTTFEFYDGAFREIQHIAALAPMGTSGGPWVNAHGELIGVQSAAMSINNNQQGIAFVAPWTAIRALLKNPRTIESATMNAAVEEIWGQSPETIGKLPKNARGLVARHVRAKGAAALAGLREWDLITAIDTKPVERTDDLMRRIRAKQPGQSIELKVTDRIGKNPRTLKVKLVPIK
ncbi:MAG: S1C family serine protease [Verrucomicrobiota bacterium]|nr:S1C family serine protease [Verrucomicrobiota bacterium]